MNEFAEISWAGVIVGAVAALLFGVVWFNKRVFGTKWAEGSGIELSVAPTPFSMLSQFVGFFFMSLVVGITAQFNMLNTALFSILAVAFVVVSIGSFAKNTTYAMVVDFFFMIVCGVIMIASQAIF
jgi:hypothetical protein